MNMLAMSQKIVFLKFIDDFKVTNKKESYYEEYSPSV